ncbi:MAG: hypothetical protein P8K78_05165, partial [Pirellulales bacterium]|nr:hypothetical protein [Pirellulales bacterium]
MVLAPLRLAVKVPAWATDAATTARLTTTGEPSFYDLRVPLNSLGAYRDNWFTESTGRASR